MQYENGHTVLGKHKEQIQIITSDDLKSGTNNTNGKTFVTQNVNLHDTYKKKFLLTQIHSFMLHLFTHSCNII